MSFRSFFLLVAAALVLAAPAQAQTPGVITARHNTSVPLRAMTAAPNVPYRGTAPFVVPNTFHAFGDRPAPEQPVVTDPVADRGAAAAGDAFGNVLLSVPGMNINDVGAASGNRPVPPDPSGSVGPNHYVQMLNAATAIYGRDGALAMSVPNHQFWQGLGGVCQTTNRGDPIVLYDEYADRWLVSKRAYTNTNSGPWAMCVAISATPDPTGAYHQYEFPLDILPDYPKLGVWRDAYTMTISAFDPATVEFVYSEAVVLEREQMLQGLPAKAIHINTLEVRGNTVPLGFGVVPADADGGLPPAGAPAIFLARAGNGLGVFGLTPDWTTPANSTFALINGMGTAPYTPRGPRIPQPGTTTELDALSTFNMLRLQYRNQGTHQMLMFNHTVDVNGQAAPRWYELRDGGTGTWSVYQQGTYAPSDGHHRWMGSVAMNDAGDIGLAYSVSSASLFPSLRFTGQTAAASGTGVMNVPETSIHAGAASQRGTTRWGDYSQLSIDPVGGNRFWYTGEYKLRTNNLLDWATRIAQFEVDGIAPAFTSAPDALSVALDAEATTTRPVTISNTAAAGAGALTVAASVANLTSARLEARAGAGGPDAFGHTWTDSNDPGGPAFAWTDISGTGTAVALGLNVVATVALPFSFPFYGDAKTQVIVTENGYLTFGTAGTINEPSFTNQDLPSAAAPNDLIATYWKGTGGLSTSSAGSVHYQDMGDGRFVVQFTGVPNSGNTSERNTFQTILYASGQIDFQYLTVAQDTSDPNTYTIGIENATGTDALQVVYNAAYVQDNLAVRMLPPGVAPAGSWATVAPAALSVAPGTSSALTVSFDASGLTEGTYTGDLVLTTNDPNAATRTVPLTLTVSGSNVVTGGPGWRLLAPGASGMTVDDFAALNLVQGVPGYNPAAGTNLFTGYDGAQYTATGAGAAVPSGRGVAWYFYDRAAFGAATPPPSWRATPFALASQKTPVTADTPVGLSPAGNGFNLLGNPFGVSLDVSGAGTWPGNEALASTVVQMYNSAAGSYESSMTRPTIAPWQGFFAEAASAGTLTIPAAARTTGGTLQRGASATEALVAEAMLAFELAQADGPLADRAAVLVMGDGRETGADRGDAAKLTPPGAAHVLLAVGDDQRAVESRPVAPVTLPLAVASVGAGTDLVLTWPRVEGLPDGWAATLHDTDTGTLIDLAETAAYAFSVAPTEARADGAAPTAVRVASLPTRFVLAVGPRAVSAESASDAVLALASPFPNPAQDRARVAFSLAEAGSVRLSVFDALGREVAVLAQGDLGAGSHERTLDGARLAAGVYIVRLVAGDRVLAQRATLTR